jgi:septum formation protein
VISPETDETPIKGEEPRQLVRRLARQKSISVAATLKPGPRKIVIIAADTIVVAPNGMTILNKPVSRAQAFNMIKSLAGKTHTVLTGYCLFTISNKRGTPPSASIRVVTTSVKIRNLTHQQINDYLAVGESMDKAGAYAAQGTGMTLVETIQGSYTNVVGLPMTHLMADLEKLT